MSELTLCRDLVPWEKPEESVCTDKHLRVKSVWKPPLMAPQYSLVERYRHP